jgi:hypothetical protein
MKPVFKGIFLTSGTWVLTISFILMQSAYAQNQTTNNNMTTYENQTLGIAFEYPGTDWEVSQTDFSELADEELSVEPTGLRVMSDNPTPQEYERFNEILKTKLTIKILDIEEILNPDTLQLEPISVSDFCASWRASLSERTLETGSSFDDYKAYWLSYQIGKDEITTVANQTACHIDSVALHDNVQEMFDIDVYFQNEKTGKAYLLTFSTDPKDVPTMAPIGQKMIDSFRFI